SEESIRYRFFGMLKDTPHEIRVRYCNIDYDREIAIVAESTKNGKKKLLGVTRLSIDPDGKGGEMAFIVGDKWQGLGLGTKLVDYALEIAKEMGVENIYSIMLPDNYRALSLTKKMGFNLEYLNDGTVKGVLDLREEILEERSIRPKNKRGDFSNIERPDFSEAKGNAEAKKETEAEAKA
ncbi:GNAT family N-acetyltransferase, partial [Candidatus Bathyarchaeota archaeon]